MLRAFKKIQHKVPGNSGIFTVDADQEPKFEAAHLQQLSIATAQRVLRSSIKLKNQGNSESKFNSASYEKEKLRLSARKCPPVCILHRYPRYVSLNVQGR